MMLRVLSVHIQFPKGRAHKCNARISMRAAGELLGILAIVRSQTNQNHVSQSRCSDIMVFVHDERAREGLASRSRSIGAWELSPG